MIAAYVLYPDSFFSLWHSFLDGSVGVIESAFGKSGKFKVFFANGTTKDTSGSLILNFKKYLYAKDKKKLVQ